MRNNQSDPQGDESVFEMVQNIKAGALDPKILTKEQRQLCVEALYCDSASPTFTAHFLKVTDRTVRRDLADIRVKHELTPNPEWVRQTIGEFVMFARIHQSNLMKLARDSGASVGERAQAAYYAHLVGSDTITKLQSLGYLPKSPDALLLMEKKEKGEADGKIFALLAALDDMSKIEDNPEEVKKLTDLKKIITDQEKNNHEK